MAEVKNNGAERWEFDFSKISAAQFDEFAKSDARQSYRNSLKIVRLALVDVPADWPEDLSMLPLSEALPLSKKFFEIGKDLEVPSSGNYRFNVEKITAADVEDFMLGARFNNLQKQSQIMARYEVGLQKSPEKRLDAWKASWTGADKKRYADWDEKVLIEQMNADALMEAPYADFKAARSKFMDEVLNLGKNLNGQS